jgi:GxxExxY protein
VPVTYDGMEIEGGYKIDLLVDGQVVVELKVVEQLLEVHKA